MRFLKKIIGIGVVGVLWIPACVNAQTSQPADNGSSADQPQSMKERTDAIRNFQNQFDNAADLERAMRQRAMDELGSRLRLTPAQEERIAAELSQLENTRFDMPIPKLLENGSRDPEFPRGTLNNDCRVSWSAWVELVEAVDDQATPVAVLRSRIKAWEDALAKARADARAVGLRIASELTARQIALYPAFSLLGDTYWRSFNGYKLDNSAKTGPMMSQVAASSSNPYGSTALGVHQTLQAVLKISDDDYAVLKPRVDAVCLAREMTSGSCTQFSQIKNKGGHISDLANMNYDGILGVLVELDAAVRDPDTTEEVFAEEERELSTAVRQATKDFNKAQDDLRSVLTTRQEAIMILEGVLD